MKSNTTPVSNKMDSQTVPDISMAVVHRDDMPQITSVEVDGVVQQLGVLKDFRKHPSVAKFMPETPERASFSWVRLLPGETLAVHAHPTKTFIIICEGEGYCTGDLTEKMESGTIVMVSPNYLHGFCGAGEKGFWALSIQFEGLALYEDTAHTRVKFDRFTESKPSLKHIFQAQEFFINDYKNNALFDIIKKPNFKQDYCDPLLDAIQHWSHCFQQILKTRLQYAQSKVEYDLALEHLEEEKDHDVQMASMRGNPTLRTINPVIAEISQWFCDKMQYAKEEEKLILMHLVLEGSAEYAHNAIYPYVEDGEVEAHFRLHAEEDEDHVQMGIDALASHNNVNYENLLTSLLTGWVMINRLCEQMSQSAYQSVLSGQNT